MQGISPSSKECQKLEFYRIDLPSRTQLRRISTWIKTLYFWKKGSSESQCDVTEGVHFGSRCHLVRIEKKSKHFSVSTFDRFDFFSNKELKNSSITFFILFSREKVFFCFFCFNWFCRDSK